MFQVFVSVVKNRKVKLMQQDKSKVNFITADKLLKEIQYKYLIINMDLRCWTFLYAYSFLRYGYDFANMLKPIFIKEEKKKAYVRLVFEIPKNVKTVKIRNNHVNKIEIVLSKPDKIPENKIVKIENIDDLRKLIRILNEIDELLS